MRNAYTYASILSAVGRVLDEAGVRRFAIHPSDDGLVVEGLDATGQSQQTWRYDVPALYALLADDEQPVAPSSEGDSTLRGFLRQRELVGAL